MAVLETAAERLALPAEALGSCRVLLSGGSHVCIENHKGLLEYSPQGITVSRRGGMLRIRGEALEIAAMDSEGLIIKGQIYGVDME